MAVVISEIDLYDLLKGNLGETGAKALVNFVDARVENGFEHKKDVLATKQDIAELRVEIAQSKSDIIKWLFVFLIGQTATIIGLLKLMK